MSGGTRSAMSCSGRKFVGSHAERHARAAGSASGGLSFGLLRTTVKTDWRTSGAAARRESVSCILFKQIIRQTQREFGGKTTHLGCGNNPLLVHHAGIARCVLLRDEQCLDDVARLGGSAGGVCCTGEKQVSCSLTPILPAGRQSSCRLARSSWTCHGDVGRDGSKSFTAVFAPILRSFETGVLPVGPSGRLLEPSVIEVSDRKRRLCPSTPPFPFGQS